MIRSRKNDKSTRLGQTNKLPHKCARAFKMLNRLHRYDDIGKACRNGPPRSLQVYLLVFDPVWKQAPDI